ncbi:ATP-binding protein [Streptomyces spectabilis]|uniref:ATP-binding protein n=1 Tax=Streptomyces spectabilis TaxID=68270 RepID=A0A516R8B0_STRST|nr:ATP-binding protein [Streptomyces spectabilis]QDQ11885.1 ATP-binding protein [Streptomyces spectabilis]
MSLSRQQRFPRSSASVGGARAFVVRALMEWGLSERGDDIRLCVSELATNALLHGVPPGREFAVRLTLDGGSLRIEVRDSGGGSPEARQPDPCAPTGRGLYLVRALADDFGVTEHRVGKTVWVAFKGVGCDGGRGA